MNVRSLPGYENAFGMLRQFVRRDRKVERCELCSAELRGDHPHLIETGKRKLFCSCEACAILFGGAATRYKRVPRRIQLLADFRLSEGRWDSLRVPIGMAFFFHSTPDQRVAAFYPSPAGATESLLALETWKDLEDSNPVLKQMEADVEALLVNRIPRGSGSSNPEYYILPIDECYKLVGIIRARWRGLSGGTEVWQDIGTFFDSLKARATTVREDAIA